ncbi:FecCD family ABC transporter permease [Saccharomonospora xinjiangensis]|uniref:ABC-type Fe3+-siderophore transport system, permease component n=1 Tax=Saccharomonospora xinjiangensis XJ-54 TaxID=882086 RepID=I0V1S0_9PSEU|nr:iron ABC transporter permease [Saccharomonospora xinjiangensis]EID54073.1 ABC-type Fe3+-siderophore transport system, permease component [Saccharomonospora xinjiangensis XJ-54]
MKARSLVVFGVLAGLLPVAAMVQLATGTSGADSLAVLAGGGDDLMRGIVLELRLPRVLVAIGAGACLGVAGCVLQAVLRNPLASPEVTGIGSGAVLGAVAATVFGAGGEHGPSALLVWAIAGGIAGGGLLWLVTAHSARDEGRLVVVGVLVSAVLSGAALVLLTARPQLAGAITQWLIGSLTGRGWEHWHLLWPWVIGVLVAAVAIAGVLDILSVGAEHATVVGVAVRPWQGVAVLVAVVSASVAIATVGALAFVGLLAPHGARYLVGTSHRTTIPASALLGAITVSAADTVATRVTAWVAGSERQFGLPAGAITAVLGAVVLIRVARRVTTSKGQ